MKLDYEMNEVIEVNGQNNYSSINQHLVNLQIVYPKMLESIKNDENNKYNCMQKLEISISIN